MLHTFKLLIPLALIAATGVGGEVRYNRAGELVPPANYRDWVFLTSGFNMNYGDEATGAHGTFDNIFVDPKSWRAFKATGHWPQGTVFVKEGRRGSTKGSINKSGQFQTEQRAYLELHVRDRKRFRSGWGFFEFDGSQPARVLPTSASCYSCHQQHAATETTFVQFYPTAKPVAAKAGTFDASR